MNNQFFDNECEIKRLENKYKIKNAEDFEKLIKDKSKILKEKKKLIHDNDYINDFVLGEKNNLELVDALDKITDELNIKKYKSGQLAKAIEVEDNKLFDIDETILKELYDDANENLNNLSKSFSDFTKFHNDMCSMRKNKFIDEKKIIDNEIIKLESKVLEIRKLFINNFVEFKISVDNKVSSLFDEYYSAKKDYEEVLDDYNKYKETKKEISKLKILLSEIEKTKPSMMITKINFQHCLKKKLKN